MSWWLFGLLPLPFGLALGIIAAAIFTYPAIPDCPRALIAECRQDMGGWAALYLLGHLVLLAIMALIGYFLCPFVILDFFDQRYRFSRGPRGPAPISASTIEPTPTSSSG